MARKMFAVALDSGDRNVEAQLKSSYDKVLAYTNSLFLVAGDDNTLTEDVAVAAGIKGDARQRNGVVFRLNGTYAGYTKRTLWEWLQDVQDG